MRDEHLEKKPRRIDITWEDLEAIFKEQMGKCYWFGIKLDPTGIFESYNPMAISADRIDDDKGYIERNVVICCRMANLGRGKCKATDFESICSILRLSMHDQVEGWY